MQLVTAARSWLVNLLNRHERGQTATENVLIIILAVVFFLIFAAIALTAHTLERGRRDQFVDRRERSASLTIARANDPCATEHPPVAWSFDLPARA